MLECRRDSGAKVAERAETVNDRFAGVGAVAVAALRIVVVSSSIVWREIPSAETVDEAKSPDQLAPPKS